MSNKLHNIYLSHSSQLYIAYEIIIHKSVHHHMDNNFSQLLRRQTVNRSENCVNPKPPTLRALLYYLFLEVHECRTLVGK